MPNPVRFLWSGRHLAVILGGRDRYEANKINPSTDVGDIRDVVFSCAPNGVQPRTETALSEALFGWANAHEPEAAEILDVLITRDIPRAEAA
jgi:hypothetical protein